MRVVCFLSAFLVLGSGVASAQNLAASAETTVTAESTVVVGTSASGVDNQASRSDNPPVMLSGEWGRQVCAAWNADPALTKGLKKSGWIEGDKNGRGFRIIEIYRSDCPDSPHVQLKFVDRDEQAICEDAAPMFDKEWDFLMYAKTERWIAMGKGEVGPMGGMMSGKLSFKGSMWEAMKNMGPFENFLLLFGKVASTTDSCN